MRDLSLHLLDLIENSIRAGATVIAVTVQADEQNDLLRLTIEDNGPGFGPLTQTAWDPFFSTKGKKTGLGLSLLRAAAEQAGGGMALGASPLGGAMVTAHMAISHVDRSPMGDLAATVASVACTNPQLDLRVTLIGRSRFSIDPAETARLLGQPGQAASPVMLARIAEIVRAGAERAWNGLAV